MSCNKTGENDPKVLCFVGSEREKKSLCKCWVSVLSLLENTHAAVGLKCVNQVHAILRKHGKAKPYGTLFKKRLSVQGITREGATPFKHECNFVCMKL